MPEYQWTLTGTVEAETGWEATSKILNNKPDDNGVTSVKVTPKPKPDITGRYL